MLVTGPEFEICFPSRTERVKVEEPEPALLCVTTLEQDPDPMSPRWEFEGSYAHGKLTGYAFASSRVCFPFEFERLEPVR